MTLSCRIKGHIQPFERVLALEELKVLSEGSIHPLNGDEATATLFSVSGRTSAGLLRDSLAYWHAVGDQDKDLTSQLRFEATSVVARNGLAIHDMPARVRELVPQKIPSKRTLRYATHGLHEYRGKFFPQLVRSLINIARVPTDGILVDPMCGSGTTLVEGRISGRASFGLDMNPLSAFISKVKCKTLEFAPTALIAAYDKLHQALTTGTSQAKWGHSDSLPAKDQAYLERWFSPVVLGELDRIHGAIGTLDRLDIREFFLLSLSNIIRRVSWQKTDDLRVRREIKEFEQGEVTAEFLGEILASTKLVVGFLVERGSSQLGNFDVRESDARNASRQFPDLVGRVDAIITSPPYATALPYLDTDRLSLIYLGLLPRDKHRGLDTRMIGNREISEAIRQRYLAAYESGGGSLPSQTRELVDRVAQLNESSNVGFRRRNMAALLSKYFFDMKAVLEQSHSMLRPNGTMFLVVGNNQTTAGGELVEIQTAGHLQAIATEVGFKALPPIGMEMLASRDIFRRNAMPSEQIVRLTKGQ
ncbi:hypothetical protein FJW08_20520 [Mesorhizobium sp. B3-2-1]|uniref:hypothetical protein n=1 Tax=Mesorhizobium sp. B3-2-1 TaxID=2589891 RepID=UPI00112BF1D0|nr:hypothetical protein [Mesorhizobium sp. B3-2-1]TPI28463.1 hypothetical protein FJW08_20520 [Mesorhizobium sp. B3-2-1]